MDGKEKLLRFRFETNGIKETFAINISDISHYYLSDSDNEEWVVLQLYYKGVKGYEEFHGDNAIIIASAIDEAMSNGDVYTLALALEDAYKFPSSSSLLGSELIEAMPNPL